MSCSVDHEFISGLSKDRTNILDSTQVDHWNWDPHIKEETLKSYINRVLETRIPLVKKERGGNVFAIYVWAVGEKSISPVGLRSDPYYPCCFQTQKLTNMYKNGDSLWQTRVSARWYYWGTEAHANLNRILTGVTPFDEWSSQSLTS